MRRAFSNLLAAAICLGLGGCAQAPAPSATPTPSAGAPFTFTRETMPRLDGSTSTAPLAEAVCSVLLGEGREEVADLVRFSKTTAAYYNLMSGGADLLIVGEPNADVLAEKENLGFEWERAPFATDGFVFVVNEDNPVDSITIDEARKIYTGEVTNWKELGGEDREIVPFQRNSEAGSQTLMEKLVMRGAPMMEAPTGYIVGTMGQLMEAVKGYDGSPGAIGYSVYYYAEEMKMARGLKILALEGVEPNPGTIRAGDYPLVNPKYVVIPADAAEDAPNRVLFNWLLGEEGQRLVAHEGYVSILEADQPEPGAREGPLPAVGTRWYEGYTDALIPGEGYGLLIPYAGQRLMDDWPAQVGCTYGLMTAEGAVVTDPVFGSVTRPGYLGEDGRWHTHPLLILSQGDPTLGEEEWNPARFAVADHEGRWMTGFDYRCVQSARDGLLLFQKNRLTLMSPAGEILEGYTAGDLGLTEAEFDGMISDVIWGEGVGGAWCGDYLTLGWWDDNATSIRLFRRSAAEQVAMPYDEWAALRARDIREAPERWRREKLEVLPPEGREGADLTRDALLGDDAPGLLTVLVHSEDTPRFAVYRMDGTNIPQLDQWVDPTGSRWYRQVGLVGGLIEVLDLNTASYYQLDTLECVFRTHLGYEGD